MGDRRAILGASHLGPAAGGGGLGGRAGGGGALGGGLGALRHAGRTESFDAFYDPALGETGRFIGAMVLNRAEEDRSVINGWFGEPDRAHDERFVLVLARQPEEARASWGVDGRGQTVLYCDVETTPRVEPLQTSFFLAVLLAERAARAAGWTAALAGSLARVAASALYPRRIFGFSTAWIWLESEREDFVTGAFPGEPSPEATGCAVLFVNYLHHQLGFGWRAICGSPETALSVVAGRLAGDGASGADDMFDRFASQLASHHPPGGTSPLRTDNPFPLAAPAPATAGRAAATAGRPAATVGRPAATVGRTAVKTAHGRDRRVCLLTGASGVLGRFLCRTWGDDYEVAGVHHRHDPPDGVYAIAADLSSPEACERAVEDALAKFGQIDLVINAAVCSVWGPMTGAAVGASAPAQFLINAVVPLWVASAAARLAWTDPGENRRTHRNVINVSSVSARHLYPHEGQSVYAASKAAVEHLTGHMAMEFDDIGVRVNAIAPNTFGSRVPLQRVASAIGELDRGSDTGTIVIVDGPQDRVVQLSAASPNAGASAEDVGPDQCP